MCKDDRKGGFRTLDLAKDVKLAVSKSTKLDLKRYKRGDGRGGYQLRDGWHWATRAEAEVLLEAARAKSRIAQLRERESLYASACAWMQAAAARATALTSFLFSSLAQ
eukprot:SAG31_NODE_706_length_12688_cov_41.991342_4_plen_108_part_00